MRKLSIVLGLFLLIGLPSQGVSEIVARGDTTKLVYLCRIDRMIAKPLWRSVKKSFEDAMAKKADYFLIQMNT
jgi:hypothetical protein